MQKPLFITHQPLIHPRVWQKHLAALGAQASIPAEHAHALQAWAQTIRDQSITGFSETNLRGAFIHMLFVQVLGYTQFGAGADCTLLTERPPGHPAAADLNLGLFTADTVRVIAPVELKGADTRNLDAVMPGRHKSPVTQVWEYANDTPGANLMVVSNMVELRVYVPGRGKQAYERFDLVEVANDAREYHRLRLLLAAARLLNGAALTLLDETSATERDITQALYDDYKRLRVQTIIALVQANGGEAGDYIRLAQKVLDRVLFVAFCEDRGLLPDKLLAKVIQSRNPFAPRPHWESFQNLWRFIDVGHLGDPQISAYNGGLFAPDPALDKLKLPDDMCEQLAALGQYDFATDIPVTVLGHIFEQSIEDLEKLQTLADEGQFTLAALQQQAATKSISVSGARKTHGIVYTPDFITRFIVEHSLGALLAERQAACRAVFEQDGTWRKPSKQETKDYKRLVKNETRLVEYLYWQAWLAELRSLKVCDPACGSGAFLVAAFELLEPAYAEVNEAVQSITGSFDLFDTDKDILTGNLYGVDLNAESIEISMLSLWLKTAKLGKKLENLHHTLKVGNSIVGTNVGDTLNATLGAEAMAALNSKAFDWQTAFPEVAAAGGFDVVLGNPPYVRMEILKPIKPYLDKHYAVASDRADLYAYFFEQGLRLLRPGGYLGYISSSTFFKTGSGEPLRRYLTQYAHLQAVVDFGDLQVFEGVTTYPAVVVAKKNALVPGTGIEPVPHAERAESEPAPTSGSLRFLQLTNELPKALDKHFATHAQTMQQSALLPSGWQFEGDAKQQLRSKLTDGRKTLKEVFGSPLYGIKTGLNEAFVIDRRQRDALVAAQPKCSNLIKPFLEGKDLKKWRVEPQDLWLIYIPKNRINIDDYPGIKAHLLPFKPKLEARATKQAWFELQQAQEAYTPAMEKPKLIYGHFASQAIFSFDQSGAFSNDKSYLISCADAHVAALLNSKIYWYLLQSLSPAVRGGFHELRVQYVETLPISEMTQSQRSELAGLAAQAQAAAEARRDCIARFGGMVLRDFAGSDNKLAAGKLPKEWQAGVPSFNEFTALIKSRYKHELSLTEKNDWQAALDAAREQVRQFSITITTAEQAIDQLVYKLFDLTEQEVALVEGGVD